jgi:hypothetical protein
MDKQKLGLLGSVGVGAGLGAGLMYLLDPEEGGRRRALVRGKAVHSLRLGGQAALRTSRDLGNRTKGLVAEAGSRLRRHEEEVDDRILRDRVRSKLGRAVSHPSAIGAALGAVGLGLLARGMANRGLPGLNGGSMKSRRGEASASSESLGFESLA